MKEKIFNQLGLPEDKKGLVLGFLETRAEEINLKANRLFNDLKSKFTKNNETLDKKLVELKEKKAKALADFEAKEKDLLRAKEANKEEFNNAENTAKKQATKEQMTYVAKQLKLIK